MADHMSASEAWEIVKAGEPNYGRFPGTGTEFDAAADRYARACAIVAGCVAEHEALRAHFAAPLGSTTKTWSVMQNVMDKTSALERGEVSK